MIISSVFLILGLASLILGGELLVRGAIALGNWFFLSNMVIGLTIVAFGTSAPELAVSVSAALSGISEIAIASVVGSNFANIALVLSLTALLKPIAIEHLSLNRNIPFMIVTFLTLVVMLLDAKIERTEGFIMTLGLIIYLIYVIRHAKRTQVSKEESLDRKHSSGALIMFLLISGMLLVSFGGYWLVYGASALAILFGVSESVIGLTVIAVGTSLPEIATSIVALMKGYSAIAIGNIVGSNIWNTFGVLGVTSIITQLDQGQLPWHTIAVMCFSGMILWIMSKTQQTINRYEGGTMLTAYALYQWWLFSF